MTEPKRRRWFQLHLSTVIVLTLISGSIIGLNVHPFYSPVPNALETRRGWPFLFFREVISNTTENQYAPFGNSIIIESMVRDGTDGTSTARTIIIESRASWYDLYWDIAIGLLLMFSSGLVLETRFRRREAKRHD